ncbi:MAG: methionyl-tRNA formyltransferase [Candidatus Omnitrophota bacterium]|nr:MAG: methionyl-tRNA formyltransferase [Candidatus Omnitrophota bacterium]
MKIIYFGTSDFAASILEAVTSSRHKISAVVTAPDKKKGRGQKVGASPVKLLAQKKSLALLQPQDLHDAKFINSLKAEGADLFIVCAYGRILTKEILKIPREYAINLHPSLLPEYRGAAPINWAIIQGKKETGVTIFKMNEYMDRGEIILQEKAAISHEDTAVTLAEKLISLGEEALLKALDLIEQKKASFSKQDEARSSFAPKLKKKDGLINWKNEAFKIHNQIRGMQPWPCAFTYLDKKLLKIWQSEVVKGKRGNQCGEITEIDAKRGILVQTGKDNILITNLQLEGKRRMSALEFIAGHKIKTGQKLG